MRWITQLECRHRHWCASPTRLHAFKLNMHHISGNCDLPTFPFISSVRGNIQTAACRSGFIVYCALNYMSTTYMSATWQAEWGEFIQLYCFDLHWFHRDAPPTLTHLYRVLNGGEPWHPAVSVKLSPFQSICHQRMHVCTGRWRLGIKKNIKCWEITHPF